MTEQVREIGGERVVQTVVLGGLGGGGENGGVTIVGGA